MTNQEAIDIIKTAIAQVEWDYPMDYAAAFDKAIEALELLKTQEPRVMTPEEIKPADDGGRMYWLELRQGTGCYPALMTEPRQNGIELAVILNKGYGPVTVGRFKQREYNVFWRCWTERPTEEQRKAVKWDADAAD